MTLLLHALLLMQETDPLRWIETLKAPSSANREGDEKRGTEIDAKEEEALLVPFAALTVKQGDVVIPALLKLLDDKTRLFAGGESGDFMVYERRHRAAAALERIALRSYGAFPDWSSDSIPDAAAAEAEVGRQANIVENWKAWWVASRRATPAQWRRAAVDDAIKAARTSAAEAPALLGTLSRQVRTAERVLSKEDSDVLVAAGKDAEPATRGAAISLLGRLSNGATPVLAVAFAADMKGANHLLRSALRKAVEARVQLSERGDVANDAFRTAAAAAAAALKGATDADSRALEQRVAAFATKTGRMATDELQRLEQGLDKEMARFIEELSVVQVHLRRCTHSAFDGISALGEPAVTALVPFVRQLVKEFHTSGFESELRIVLCVELSRATGVRVGARRLTHREDLVGLLIEFERWLEGRRRK